MELKWYADFYLSDNLADKRNTIKNHVARKLHIRPLFLIVLSDYEDGQLEIIPLSTLKLPFFYKKEYQVVGVAKGYYHARSLVERIVGDVYRETSTCDCKGYFCNKMNG